MAKDRISMPSGMGGIVRYFEGAKSKLTLKPIHVIIIIIAIMVIELLLHWQGLSLLGLQ